MSCVQLSNLNFIARTCIEEIVSRHTGAIPTHIEETSTGLVVYGNIEDTLPMEGGDIKTGVRLDLPTEILGDIAGYLPPTIVSAVS